MLYVTPTSRTVCESEAPTPGRWCSRANRAALSFAEPPTTRRCRLHPVDEVGDRLELCAAPAPEAAEAIERVRDADQAALLSDGRYRLDRGETRRHHLPQEDRDQVAVGRLDLLADDDRQFGRGGLASAEGAVDSIVVGDGQMRQTARNRRASHGCGIGNGIEARAGVAVQVDKGPPDSTDLGRSRGRHHICGPRYFL